MNRIILDTSAYINLFTGDNKVFSVLSSAETVYISAIVAGELHSSFSKTAKGLARKNEFMEFVKKPTVKFLQVTEETAEIYGKLISDLRNAGTPLPINDVWIAANAFETGSVIVTYDRHFLKIPGLRIWDELRHDEHK